jgi:hypothetical protein
METYISYIVEAHSIRYVYLLCSCISYFKRQILRTPKLNTEIRVIESEEVVISRRVHKIAKSDY